MTFKPEHELHKRRFSRNLGLGLTLAAFIAIVFGLTIVKVSNGTMAPAFDHTMRPQLLPKEGGN